MQVTIGRQSPYGYAPMVQESVCIQESVCRLEMPQAVKQGNSWPMTFRERFCEQFKCELSLFEEAVFWRCLNRPHAWFFAKFIFPKRRFIFKEDLDFIHELGGVHDPLIFKNEVNRYHGRNVRERGWIRGTFGIRVSGKRVMKLKNRIFRNIHA
jgi:hypothetical protein